MAYDFSNLTQLDRLEQLSHVWGNITPPRDTLFREFGEFKHGHTFMKDDECTGTPSATVTEKNIAAVAR